MSPAREAQLLEEVTYSEVRLRGRLSGVTSVEMPSGDEAVVFRIVVDRPNARRHLAFGHGIHRCVGARLAELQIGVLMEEMAKRRMRVNVTGEPERVAACFVHGYRKLPVEISRY